MKGPWKTGILVLVLVCIWILVAFKSTEVFRSSLPPTGINQDGAEPSGIEWEKRAFSLKLDYRDPFSAPRSKAKKTVPKRRILEKKEMAKPPAIRYLGRIGSEAKAMGLIEEDGNQRFIREGESIQGVTLLQIRDSLLVFGTHEAPLLVRLD